MMDFIYDAFDFINCTLENDKNIIFLILKLIVFFVSSFYYVKHF